MVDARRHGAHVLTYHEVVGFIKDQNRVTGVELLDTKTGERSVFHIVYTVIRDATRSGAYQRYGIARHENISVGRLAAPVDDNIVYTVIAITGGKLMTYRLMAEWATDLACKKLGVNVKCRTADIPLPGSELDRKEPQTDMERKSHVIALSTDQKAAEGRHGSLSAEIEYTT